MSNCHYYRPGMEEIAEHMDNRCHTSHEVADSMGTRAYRYIDETLFLMARAHMVEKIW